MLLMLDIETYSSVDLPKHGVYKYASSPDFEILLLAYAYDDEPVQLIDIACGEEIPAQVLRDLSDPAVIKEAYNANFERTCLAHWLGTPMPPEQWRDTMIAAQYCGLPRSLDMVGKALKLGDDQAKMKEGKALITYFCKPCKPTKANGGRTRNYPSDAPDKWEIFRRYNIRDVEAEREIAHRLASHPVPDEEWRVWHMDQRINDRGVRIDRDLAEAAVTVAEQNAEALTDELIRLTRLENPNSIAQLKAWLASAGEETESLSKDWVTERLKDMPEGDAKRVLEIRRELGKSSISKYEAMLRSADSGDDRVRGTLQHYGANRTGRWAGRLVQVQNLPQNHLPDLETAREAVRTRDANWVRTLYGSVSDTLSQLIRTALIPSEGHLFAVSDFSAIEARLVAWLSGESWRQEVFASGGDIYCASASQMFHVPVEKHGVNGHLRQKGKVAELALGYGGGAGALTAMGALKMGLSEDELPDIVTRWREASPRIVSLWWRIDEAARQAVTYKTWSGDLGYGLRIGCESGMMIIELPSGRRLHYCHPRVEEGKFGKPCITYCGANWTRENTYGPKLVENIVQATGRDCLAAAMLKVSERYPIVMHVHDEMIAEVPEDEAEEALKYMNEKMAEPLKWADGLLLRGDGYLCKFYKKD